MKKITQELEKELGFDNRYDMSKNRKYFLGDRNGQEA